MIIYVPCSDNFRLDLASLKKANIVRVNDDGRSFIWYAGVNKSHTLVLLRPLPTSPSPADLYIPPDALPLGPPPNANEGDAYEEPYEEPTEMEYEPEMQVETFHA